MKAKSQKKIGSREAAEILGVNQSRIRQLCAAGRIPSAEKWGRDWYMLRSDLKRFKRLSPGRRKKGGGK